mgnify:FL=1
MWNEWKLMVPVPSPDDPKQLMGEGDKVEEENVYPVKHRWYHMASNELVKPRKMSAWQCIREFLLTTDRKSAFLELEVY